MNILFTSITPFDPRNGGLQRVADIMCREFTALGHRIFYLHLTWYREESKNYSYPAESVTILPNSDVDSEENVEFYNQFIVDNNIDVVINHNGLYEGASLFCNVRNKQVKLISVIHSNPLLNYNYLWSELTYLRDNTWIEKIKRIARCCLYFKIKHQKLLYLKQHYTQFDGDNHSKLVLLSSRYKQPLLKIAPYLSTKLYAIANPNSYEEIREILTKEKEILFVGRLDNKSKKVNRLLKIWKILYEDFPDWRLSIVGDGPDRDLLENYSHQMRLKRLTFYGFSDPKLFYERASIICLTSDFEGFPMVLTEAMQFGCVPIAYDSFEAVRDVVIHGKTGVLVKPFSCNKYSKYLGKLMSDNELLKTMSASAFQHVKKFDKKRIAQEWMELINRI